MKNSRLLKGDKGVLAGLLVFLLLLVMVAWIQPFAIAERHVGQKALRFVGTRNDYGRQGVPPHSAYSETPELAWSVRSTYAPAQDDIVVDLSRGEFPVDARLKVFAKFLNYRRGAVDSHWLTRVADGRYRATGVKLPLGTWTMGLTGFINAKIAFHIEQTLKVE